MNLAKAIEKLKSKEEEKRKKKSENKQKQNNRNTSVDIDEHELKEKLVKKVLNYTRSKSFEMLFDLSYISQLQKVNNKIKCTVSCPLCESAIKCEFIKYWAISNFQAHLKIHFKDINGRDVDETNADQVVAEHLRNENELNEILQDESFRINEN